MEVELEPRVKPLPYKVKAMSREYPAQKAAHLLDTDLRNHWSTGTNTKEWILLELDEPCLLSHIRIYNKSVLEWEISAGLRYKPETFSKVRSRCEAPRREITYPTNYTPCRYVRISCLRGNPIALFFIQLIGIPVPYLEPEFQPIANCLLIHISSHKQDAPDLHLQLLQDVTSRLARFLPQLESDLNSCAEAPEPTLHFLAMLAGPFYPILHIASERETGRLALNSSDYEVSKTNLSSTALTVSSNFEPRRSRNINQCCIPVPLQLVFRPDVVFSLLRKANKDPHLGHVCRLASRILLKLVEPGIAKEVSALASDMASSVMHEPPRIDRSDPISIPDYSTLFGEEFQVPDDFWDPSYLNVLDYAALEEGMFHILYACASQPLHCRKLAENSSQFWLALPLIQALLPALRPNISSPYQVDDNFSPWKQLYVQNALSQIVGSSSSLIYRPLVHACAGYLASFSQTHVKAACVLIDLCSGVLSPWMAQVIAKVDLTMELLEDLLGVVQGARLWFSRARAALKYIVLALSGNMDDVMAKYKDAKHRILFLVEMLEPYLDPSFTPLKGMIAFGNVSTLFSEIQEQSCARALNIIRTAVRKSEVLTALEAEWRHGSAPSVLLSILDPRMQLPPGIDNRKLTASNVVEQESTSFQPRSGAASSRLNTQETADAKVDIGDINGKVDASEDASLLFATTDLNRMSLMHTPVNTDSKTSDSSHLHASPAANNASQKNMIDLFPEGIGSETGQGIELHNLFADYHQLMNYRDCELKASEFRHLALGLKSQTDVTRESHDVAVSALLLAAECFINPCFMMSLKDVSPENKIHPKFSCKSYGPADIERIFRQKNIDLKLIADIERKRDRVVLEILIEAAELDRKFDTAAGEEGISGPYIEGDEDVLSLNEKDMLSADAITLVRQNQALICNFLVRHLHKGLHEEKHSAHEILMWCLLFLLCSATKLYCSPELVVGIIFNFAESLNAELKSLYYELKEGYSRLNFLKLLELQRCWILLHRLVIASSGSDERSTFSLTVRNAFRFSNLVPASVWLQKVPVFSSSVFPLVRYFGWMAIARNAKQFVEERLFLVSDLPQLTYLLSIFSDDLSLVDYIIEKKDTDKPIEGWSLVQNVNTDIRRKPSHQGDLQSFHALYPDISKFFPNLRKEFVTFGETVLEAVGLQLKSLSSSVIPDLICWLSDLCSLPFVRSEKAHFLMQHKQDYFKGFIAKNAKVVVLYILEAIVVKHMEAMVPEVPRMVQVLVSLCNSSYCDVPFLDSVLCLLKPIITYSLSKVSTEEKLLTSDSFDNFESLCFSELFHNITCGDENTGTLGEKGKGQALKMYVLATIFNDLSFKRKKELLQSALLWAEFASFEEIHSFHDYISAYQVLMENCRSLLIATSRAVGTLKTSSRADTKVSSVQDVFELSWFLNDLSNLVSTAEDSEKQEEDNTDADVYKKVIILRVEDIPSFSESLEAVIWKLYPTLEQCWILHPKLSKKLLLSCAECFIYSRCLRLTVHEFSSHLGVENIPNKSIGDLWRTSIEGLPEMILVSQEKHCWEVSSVLLGLLLGVPKCFSLHNVIGDICSVIKNFSNRAPNLSRRLQTDKAVSSLLARGIRNICPNEVSLSDMFSALLAHPEPEQRYVAIKNLARLVGQGIGDRRSLLASATGTLIAPSDLNDSAPEPNISALVSAMWDHVALMASADSSLLLRTHAAALLINFIPFAERARMQSFLTAADSILHCLTTLAQPTCNSPLTQLSLALIASVCLYSPPDDILLIPESIWRNIETFGASKNDRYCTSLEKQACEALCRLKNDGDQAKQLLKEVLSSSSQKQQSPDFVTTGESILQVIGNLTSAKSYFDFFSKEADERTMELEEAEMEMELLQNEHPPPDSSFNFQDFRQLPFMSNFVTEDHRLQQIKDEIKSIEKAQIRDEIVARRQQKLVMRHTRQRYLEEAALREAELVQKLDRERVNEVEKELERQRLLELERAKTRELQHHLEMERERQTQRDLQRELEQVESGVRTSRREFASSSHSRSRDSYRESSRDGTEGALRSSPAAVLLPGSRSFSSQVPTILQARERSDEGGTNYEEIFDGNKDSGDTGSVGDPDMISSLDGQASSFDSGQRHGSSRGSKTRQVIDRRERDSRREGKWERKH